MRQYTIGIDARLYAQTGVGTYLRNLIHFLPAYLGEQLRIRLYVHQNDLEKVSINDSRISICKTSVKWHSFAEQTVFLTQLLRDELDLMHFPYFSYPIFYPRPFLATIHDLTPLLFKTGRASTLHPLIYETKYQIFSFMLRQQIKNAKKIITPTETVRSQLISQYGTSYSEKIIPITEGVDFELLQAFERIQASGNVKPLNLPDPYFLYVGNFYPHKNVEKLVEAFGSLSQKSAQKLVLVGPENYFSNKLKSLIAEKKIEVVIWKHHVSHDELAQLYFTADALVNPSLSEGFGLPLIEAQHCGCPVIASDIPVFRELMGSSYLAFDPNSVESITKALSKPIRRDEVKNASLYSFEKMTQKTALEYTKLLYTSSD